MDSLFHFLFPVIGALAARVHVKHGLRTILILGLLAVIIDIDHYIYGFERLLFHNIFFTVALPLAIIALVFIYKNDYYMKGFSVMLFLFLSSHLILDVFTEPGVAVFYPLSSQYHTINFNIYVPILSRFAAKGAIISSYGTGMLIFAIFILLPCMFLDKIIVTMESKHENFETAMKDVKKEMVKILSG
ncbi:MAG: metal-dependent hydrolase [archaeon]|nr:MAG: metal-dependent hydrolase [archaeon]